MPKSKTSPKLIPVLINRADNIFIKHALKKTDVAGRGFKVAELAHGHAQAGCNKLFFSHIVPGIEIVHAPKEYFVYLKFMYGRSVRPRKATPILIEQAIRKNAERYGLAVTDDQITDEITDMLAPASYGDSFEVGCSDAVYAEFVAEAA